VVEQGNHNPLVGGSNPSAATSFSYKNWFKPEKTIAWKTRSDFDGNKAEFIPHIKAPRHIANPPGAIHTG
jgi:hypothetical protein